MESGDLAERAEEEVRGLHAFFVDWFRAETAQSTDFARCEAALAPDFRMVTPDGGVHARASVVERIRSLRGSAPGDFAIEIVQPSVVWRGENAILLEFVEEQYRGGRKTSRRSTGLFTGEAGAPSGVLWRHLQETWIGSQ